jgi:hypothetical protein
MSPSTGSSWRVVTAGSVGFVKWFGVRKKYAFFDGDGGEDVG